MNSAHPSSFHEPASLSTPPVAAPRQQQRASGFASRAGTARPPIHLHIEELVLHGFSPHDRHRIAEAMETELHRLLTEQGLAGGQPRDHSIERLDAGEFTATPGASARTLGTQVAQSVYRASSSGASFRPDIPAVSNRG